MQWCWPLLWHGHIGTGVISSTLDKNVLGGLYPSVSENMRHGVLRDAFGQLESTLSYKGLVFLCCELFSIVRDDLFYTAILSNDKISEITFFLDTDGNILNIENSE